MTLQSKLLYKYFYYCNLPMKIHIFITYNIGVASNVNAFYAKTGPKYYIISIKYLLNNIINRPQ